MKLISALATLSSLAAGHDGIGYSQTASVPQSGELIFSNYQYGDLRLHYQPPSNNGGETITKYKIEWDAVDIPTSNFSGIAAGPGPQFTPSSQTYGYAEVTSIREVQDIIVSCRSTCTGTFLLSWGGRVTETPLRVDATADEVETAINYLMSPFNTLADGLSAVRVTRKAYGFAYKWRVTFMGVAGDIGLIKANGDLLVGVGSSIRVEEVTQGSSDLYPGAYTNEVQTISVRKRRGFGCETLAGSFALSFEGEVTSQIDIDVSAEELKELLESLSTIHTVNVRTDHHTSIGPRDCSFRSWIVTFTNLVHETQQASGDLREIKLHSSSLADPSVTEVYVSENIKGTYPRAFSIVGLVRGMLYYCRVSAYNALGYGVSSTTVSGTPMNQPPPPRNVILSHPDPSIYPESEGTSLVVSWQAADENGGGAVTEYKVDWYSAKNDLEVQKLTTSSSNGVTEIQSIKISADTDGITGFFTLSFDGETTELISHDAEADGEESVEAKLERLSTIGDVEVSRDLSWMSIPDVEFDLTSASNIITRSGGGYSGTLEDIISEGDAIQVGGEVHTVSTVDATSLILDATYLGPSAWSVHIHKWSYGYEYTVTFTSHVGEQSLIEASPANNWAGTNPTIEVSRKQKGMQPLSGTLRLGLGNEATIAIPFDVNETLVKQALEALDAVGEVNVDRHHNNNGYNYFITFLSDLGNIDQLTIDDSQLTGPDARARIVTLVDGVPPSDYGSIVLTSDSTSSSMKYKIDGLKNGVAYYVRVHGKNAKGFGYAAVAPPMVPMTRSSSPTSITMTSLSDSRIRISWRAPEHNGGSPVRKFVVQWDTDPSFPSAWINGFYYERLVEVSDDGVQYCHTFYIDPTSAAQPRYGRVLAYNGYDWSEPQGSVVAHAEIGTPGPVRNFNAFASSSTGILVQWAHPAIDDSEACDYAGDGGSEITHYTIEYDKQADFSSPATSVVITSSSTEYRIGGRNPLTGAESTALDASGTYYVRIVPFNSMGPGVITTFPSPIGPLKDNAPDAPVVTEVYPVSATSVRVDWNVPSFDGGRAIQEYLVEYDVDANFAEAPRNVSVATDRQVHTIQINSDEPNLNVQIIQATVEVTNEVQSIKTEIEGVDEVQKFSTTCDDVTAEVQMIVTTAVDINEEQVVSLIAEDVDEIQLLRLEGDSQPEIQSVQVSVPRLNEIQKLGIVISNINTAGDGIISTACMGLGVGDSCQDVEDAISGSFTVSFDFDECGGGNGSVNYCQLALSEYDADVGTIMCSPGLVTDPFSGGNHCVSNPVILSYSRSEGDTGTLQHVLNNLVDDNGVPFMTSANMPAKQEAVTVSRQGRIKTKGSCVLDPLGLSPAACSGEYELLYEITFDAYHTSGDVPPVTVVTSDIQIDTASSSYITTMCPGDYYILGCELPVGAALDSNHASFYNGEAASEAIEFTKGAQPSGFISLDYECESLVVALPGGSSMIVSADGMSASFDDVSFVGNMTIDQWVRFSAGDGLDHYRRVAAIDAVDGVVSFEERAPILGATYSDVEYGYYFSDWNEMIGISGVSSYCAGARRHTTLPIDVNEHSLTVSETDWRGKIGALSVIEASGVVVSRHLTLDLNTAIGLIWDVTFQKQPGNIHSMACETYSGNNQCFVSTLQDSSVIGGSFKLQTMWPHEYVVETPELFETDSIRWNANPLGVKNALEAITDADGNKVFGTVQVTRSPYVPPGDLRWSGGYLWTVTFLSRGGNIPALTFDDSALTGLHVQLGVSDEDSGETDLFRGLPNSATFADNDPGISRDGNQITGSFALSWSGSAYHDAITTSDVFTVQTGGSLSDQYTALSADAFRALFEEHVLNGKTGQVDVIRSEQPTQWMGYSYTIKFRHEDVGGDLPSLVYMVGGSLGGNNAHVRVDETVKGTELRGTFQLRFEGETTRPIAYDASALDIQSALNELNSIAPSAVVVSGGSSAVRSGPSDGIGGASTQVNGRIWYVTFASNVWKNPTVAHDSSFVPGNWIGPPASYSDVWGSGFSKAWGKNVGNVPMISCLSSGLTTSNGALPDDGCTVSELIAGTDPLGGAFKICLDSASSPNGVMSVESDSCTDFIAHNAAASAIESGGDGSSVEEKLESLDNVGDVHVTRSSVDTRNGGYTWTVEFLRDADGPCEQKDDVLSLCNAPGNVPKLCGGSTPCNTASLKGTCLKPGTCSKLTVLDATDHQLGLRFPGGVEKQVVFVKDSEYLGWQDGSVVDITVTKEYRLIVNGVPTTCIRHNAPASEMAAAVQVLLDEGIGGSVHVVRTQAEDVAENGFMYYLNFYNAGDVPLLVSDFSAGICSSDFEVGQTVTVAPMTDGYSHASDCNDCVDGIVLRGDFQLFEVAGDNLVGSLAWNAEADDVKNHLEQANGRTVDVTRTILDKHGAVEWTVTFSENPNTYPSGSGNVMAIIAIQDPDTSGRSPTIEVSEVARGSDGLAGTFDLDYQASGGPQTFSFNETPQRMLRKLEQMSTIGNVFVTRDCYPNCLSGGWGGNPVVPGTIGGYQWTVYFLKNPGNNDGFTFPPGSGIMNAPAVNDSWLRGEEAAIKTSISSLAGSPIAGAFQLVINEEETGPIPYNIDARALEQTINDLGAAGRASIESGYRSNFLIPDITASVVTDGKVALVNGDLREYLAPGASFRIGGSQAFDGAELAGLAVITAFSPVLSNVQLTTNRNNLFVGEQIRIASDTYSIVKNGIEVQQLTVHRSSGVGDGEAYQLSVTIDGATEVTSCLAFDESAENVEAALNSLSILGDGGVLVTRTENSSGYVGDAHYYNIYFVGNMLIGDVDEIESQHCSSGIPLGMDSSNSHFHIRTLIQGGKTEHQRVSLASDAGATNDTPAFQITIIDSDANSWTSPCYKWGVDSLDLASQVNVNAFAIATLTLSGVTDLTDNRYMMETSSFVEGILLVGDWINAGSECEGRVLSINDDGTSAVIEAQSGCSAVAGDVLYVGNDISIIDSFRDNGRSISELTVLSVFSDSEIESDEGLYKLSIEFEGMTRSTSCLRHDASAKEMQQEIDSLFDFNSDGVIDSNDANHVRVTRIGDGSSSSGFGYTYEFLSAGSPTLIGASSVLGSHAPQFSIVDIGSNGGCADSGVEDLLVTTTALASNGSNVISLGTDAADIIHAGAKIRVSSSLVPSKVYSVDHTNLAGTAIMLTENFEGSSTAATSVYLIRGGNPQFNLEIKHGGLDEFVYDIFFTGAHWRNVPQVQVNKFGDGSCTATFSDIEGGMNRNIGVKTLSEGGGMIAESDDSYVLDKCAKQGQAGTHDLYTVPLTFTVHSDSSEVQTITVMDNDNTAIWSSGHPSYKLSFAGEFTGCIAYNALDVEVERALNSLTTLCPGDDACVTVTRQIDSVRAPNGHVYTIYFDSSSVARTDINDPGANGLGVDTLHPDCVAFDLLAGERISVDVASQGQSSFPFDATQIPFGLHRRWIGESQQNLPVYRVSGSYWTINFEQSLGSVTVELLSDTLSSSARSSIEVISNGINPTHATVSGLSTGIKHYFRVFSRNSYDFSSPSNVVDAIPSERPEKMQHLSSSHALHRNEIQLVTVAATHQKEVQAIRTSAIPIAEVQEVSLSGSADSNMDSYLFTLRHPEIQVVKWSAGAPVTSGSFFLKLLYVDIVNSEMSGSVIYKEMLSPCIRFDATAEEVKMAIEEGALLNGLDTDSVRVIRSGNRSYSSDYGYTYEILFVGGNVRGNMREFTSDLALVGIDSSGGSTCDVFVTPTNDATLEIWTKNDSLALGTDTPRVEIILDANIEVFDGEFQISITHFGQNLSTGCIPWGATASQVKVALETLANVDSVRVDAAAEGTSYVIYFDGNAMHTNQDGALGFRPQQGTNVVISTPGSCNPIRAYDNNVLKVISDIPTAVADVRVVAAFDGGDLLPGTPEISSSLQISSSLSSSLPMTITEVRVTESLETTNRGAMFTITHSSNDGDVPLLVCNHLPSVSTLKSCEVMTVVDANVISGNFYLASSDPIPHDASELEMKEAISGVHGIGNVEVTRSEADGQEGYTWQVTFGDNGDLPELRTSNSLTGKGATISVTEVTKGNELGGSFSLAFGGESTVDLPFDVSAEALQAALQNLHGISYVEVELVGPIDSEGGRTFAVTFNDAQYGDVEMLTVDTSQLTGLGAVVTVTEHVKGSLASRDSLHLSFDLPGNCSNSDVGRSVCGDSITEVTFDLSPNSAFEGSVSKHTYHPDYSVQVIRTSRVTAAPSYPLSGYFHVAYDGYTSNPVSARATAMDMRVALEGLPGINTAQVKRTFASQEVPSVCVNVNVGSSTVYCSELCSPCNFRLRGVSANRLIKIGDEWFRVSSTYNGVDESFTLASDHDSLVGKQYVGRNSLVGESLQIWSGGYEWIVSLLSVAGYFMPLTTPLHHLLPSDAVVDISTKGCDRCMYVNDLFAGVEYSIRARAKNSKGSSEYSDSITATPRGIPTAPVNVQVNPVSSSCLEVTFEPPIYGEPFALYTVQWDYSERFINAQDSSASCSSLRYGRCVVSMGGSSAYAHEICNLLNSELYHVRVSVANDIQVQSVNPSGNPKDNANWALLAPLSPSDQVPDPPSSLNALVLGHNSVQLLFDWPSRDGGQQISQFAVTYDTAEDFASAQTLIIESSVPHSLPASGERFVFDFVPASPELVAGLRYYIKLAAVNSLGIGLASSVVSIVPSGPSHPPNSASLSTLLSNELPVTEATIYWTPPTFDGGHPIEGYVVEWWSHDKRPEVQVVRLQYNSVLFHTTFTLSFSPSPQLKKVTSNLPWNASADLVRRELLNLGWDESDDSALLSDIKVTRTTLAKGYQWTVTFGDNPDRSMNDGDQVSLVGSVTANGDHGSPSITVSTAQDGQRSGGVNELQYLQVVGTGSLSGYYRIKFMGSEWTSFIPVHANAAYIKSALEQLSTIGEVDVAQNDAVDQDAIGTDNDLVHHYEVRFKSNPGNVDVLIIDVNHLSSSDNNANVVVYNGSNDLNGQNTKQSAANPGEVPVDYGSSGLLQPLDDFYRITGLETGKKYFVSVSVKSPLHGMSSRLIPTPDSITPTLQTPGAPQNVVLNVNSGFSDSLLVDFEPPASNGGSEVLFYRVELDPTESFDNPIVQDFQCPTSNRRTEWMIETSVDGSGVISGGSFTLELEVDGFTFVTSEIAYDSVALASNETGVFEELVPNFSTIASSNVISTIPPESIEGILFPGDRLRFSGQDTPFQYYEVVSVNNTGAVLSEPFAGSDGVQVSTTRHYGGRGTPLTSRIHCQYNQDLCPDEAENQSGSMQNKLEDLTSAIHNGVYVDRDGPNADNGFIWRITFLDDARPAGTDYQLRVESNSLVTHENQGTPQVSVRLLHSGVTYSSCSGSLVMPSYGGLVKGLEYYGRVSARNSAGYSLPMQAPEPMAPKIVPSAPTSVSLSVASSTSLRLMFGSPSDNGGDSITGYLIEWSTNSDFTNVQSTEVNNLSLGSPFFANIENLTTGSYYFVRVKAANSQGYGVSQMSTPSSLNPHQRPSPPTNVRLGITSDSMLTVGWDHPITNGGDTVTKYLVEWDTHPSFSSTSQVPNKGYAIIGSEARSYTIQLLSTAKNYYVRVQAFNTAGDSSFQTSTPSDARPRLQLPGTPHLLQAIASSTIAGRIEVSWQRPILPWHGIPCSSDVNNIFECPAPYGGSIPVSNGGEVIVEYELEFNERRDFLGTDGGRSTYTGTSAVIANLYSGRTYFIRVLARNSIGSGKYCEPVSITAL